MVLVTAPGAGGWRPELILPLLAASMVVLRDISTRYIPADVPSASVALTTAMFGVVGGLMSAPFGWVALSPENAGLLAVAAGFVAISYLAYVVAIRRGELSLVAPVQYIIILWALVFGALVWGEIPTARELAGSVVIVLAGLVILYRILYRERIGHVPAIITEGGRSPGLGQKQRGEE